MFGKLQMIPVANPCWATTSEQAAMHQRLVIVSHLQKHSRVKMPALRRLGHFSCSYSLSAAMPFETPQDQGCALTKIQIRDGVSCVVRSFSRDKAAT